MTNFLSTYQKEALRTEAPVPMVSTQDLRLVHALLGMASEIGELAEAIDRQDTVAIAEEAGDFLWFFSLGLDARGVDLGGLLPYAGPPRQATCRPLDLCFVHDFSQVVGHYIDLWKGALFYGKNPCAAAVATIEQSILEYMTGLLYEAGGRPLVACLAANTRKLRSRFPEKYSRDQALDRDLDAEREALEKS